MRRSRTSAVIGVLAAVLAIAVASVSGFVAPAPAASPASGTLSSARQVATWTDSVGSTANSLPGIAPETCGLTGCSAFSLTVRLPQGTWARPGGLAVAIQYASANDAVDLYVYRNGELVAKDEGIVSVARSVFIPEAANGTYTVYASWTAGNEHDPVAIKAMASVERPPNVSPVRQLLPDLGVLPQRQAKFATSANLFNPADNPLVSCYPDEMATGARQCLRFDQAIDNHGEGPVDLRSAIPIDPTDTSTVTYQRVYYSDGRGHYTDRVAGHWEFHAVHGHFHTGVLAESRLFASNVSGQRLGAEPLRSGSKASFCLADIEVTQFGSRGYDPRTHKPPGCLAPSESDERYRYIVSGISRGWTDVYDWYLEGQYIDMTGLPDGYYVLETTADPNNEIQESDESDNCGSALIRVTGMSAPTPIATIVGSGPAC